MQQLASGKAQIANIGGQQVVIRTSTPGQIIQWNSTNNLVLKNAATSAKTQSKFESFQLLKIFINSIFLFIYLQLQFTLVAVSQQTTPVASASTPIMTPQVASTPSTLSPVKSEISEPATPSTATGTVPTTPSTAGTTASTTSSGLAPTLEASLLAGQPPGTIIKCVTAQVIQTTQGPRIVLQGIQGNDFTAQQLNAVQQQVKQQLLKGMCPTTFTYSSKNKQ